MKIEKIKKYIKDETVLVIAVLLACVTSVFSLPKIEYIDFKVLITLFNLMIIVAAFRKMNVLDYIAVSVVSRCKSYRTVYLSLVFITFISSMFVTNDVALLTFVPITLIIGEKIDIDVIKTVVLQTIAANLGSSFTPMGNPQNIFVYNFYNIKTSEFFRITSVIVILSVIFLVFFILRGKNESIELTFNKINIKSKSKLAIFSVVLIIILLSVFHVLDYRIAFAVTVVSVLIMDRSLITRVDYSLLITFVGFFIFVGNISNMPAVKSFMGGILKSADNTFWAGLISSQFISNVPATMLLSGFTGYYKELLLAVNIGGLGTLIASLASVISYKLYVKEYGETSGKYMRVFSLYNFLGLILFAVAAKLILI
ncbi:MAG: SLC13 family permease [Inconstantimicrobium porci]|uniref:SLC13 family permease n=1 Tax=Inconstantimicrobium porci TaxID=2652291 RepID=UPI002A9152C8|nr:SLC13 family permease [Inconstantimicrobium porci]MDY5911583.1 SLC13 family permease [Inconstantimicrobium porci]